MSITAIIAGTTTIGTTTAVATITTSTIDDGFPALALVHEGGHPYGEVKTGSSTRPSVGLGSLWILQPRFAS